MSFNLLAEAQTDNFKVARYATSRRGQYNGRCIFPGCSSRNDGLRIQPNWGPYGHFECSACGRKGSGIDYLILMRGYSKQKALAEVGWKPKDGSTPHFIIPEYLFSAEQHSTHDAPLEKWQEGAESFYKRCERALWSEQGKEALAYLHGRGLEDKTLKAAHIGYHPVEEWEQGYKWGRENHVHLAKGIVIPWFFDKQIWRITIRDEAVAEGDGRYKQVAGGSNGLYLADSLQYNRLVVLVEGEFDALSVAQTCGDLVSVCATGTTEGSHTTKWLASLARKYVLIAFDAEKEKGDQAVRWWLEKLENVQRLRPLWDDANQMLQDGVDLRADWILPVLEKIQHVEQETEAAPPPEEPEVEEPLDEPSVEETEPSYYASVPQKDYWSWLQERSLRPPVDRYGKPYYTVEEWKKKLDEQKHQRPDEKLFAHYSGGYAGYCRLYGKKGA